MGGWVGGWMDGWMGGWVDGWIGWVGGWMGGWKCLAIYFPLIKHCHTTTKFKKAYGLSAVSMEQTL